MSSIIEMREKAREHNQKRRDAWIPITKFSKEEKDNYRMAHGKIPTTRFLAKLYQSGKDSIGSEDIIINRENFTSEDYSFISVDTAVKNS